MIIHAKIKLISINISLDNTSSILEQIEDVIKLQISKKIFKHEEDLIRLKIKYYKSINDYKQAFTLWEEIQERNKKQKTKKTLLAIHQFDLDRELNKLNEKNKDLINFSRILSHDLKEPLRIISQFSNILTIKNKPENIENFPLLEEIQRSSTHMSQMIDDLLNYTKLDSQHYKNERISLNTLFESVKAILQIKIKEVNATLIIPDKNIQINSSQILLFQLLQNLVSNGIKYNDKAIPKIIIESSLEGNNCVIKISDNGIGIKEQMIQYIFEPFKRVHKNKFEAEGTGLGLSICKRIVEKIKGTIEVTSIEGEGSCFTLKIPANIKQA